MSAAVTKRTDEIRFLRESNEKKEREVELRRQKKLKRNKKPLRDSFHYEDLKNILKQMLTASLVLNNLYGYLKSSRFLNFNIEDLENSLREFSKSSIWRIVED